MMARDTAVEYATRRTVEHLRACQVLCDTVERAAIAMRFVADRETRAPRFPTLDLHVLD
jgi:predicted glycosyl hydrolase (DUF1957 family)